MPSLFTIAIGAAIGAGLGALAGLLARTPNKAWAFIRRPGRGAAFGAVVGLVFAIYLSTPSGWLKGNVPVLTAEEFDKALAAADKPVIVAFYSETCPTCRQLAPRVERLAEEYEGRVLVARVDVFAERKLAARYEIRAVPTLVYFVDAKRAGRSEGAIAYRRLRERADALIEEHAAKKDTSREAEPDGALPAETAPAEPETGTTSPPDG